jgi:divalent metal cation (Fe/Co/Zn/Cd) transporter
MLVGVNVLWSGYAMVREGAGGLMDEAPPPEMVARIKELIGQHAAGAIEATTCGPVMLGG